MHTPFIGRENELQNAREILLAPTCRLLTILGTGGMGKTRLALQLREQVSSHFSEGAYFVDLQQADKPERLITAIAESLNFTFAGNEDALHQLVIFLKDKNVLLLLDNFESVMDAVPIVMGILSAAPQVKMLVTSREALRLQEEHIFMLGGLPQESATQLFLERARQVRHDFEGDSGEIHEICRLVDGTPLAIELAAVWAKLLNSGEILSELRDCLDFLATDLRNIPERHRSIRAVFNGSWARLTESERRTLKRLAIFRNGFDRTAAREIAQANLVTLSALQDKSLLMVSAEGRYSIHELIRQYARDELLTDPTECERTYTAHSRYYAQCMQTLTDKLRSSEQVNAVHDIQADIQNIRLGWSAAVEQKDNTLIQQYLLGLTLYHQMQSREQDGIDLLTLSEDEFASLAPSMLAQIRLLRGWILIIMGRNQEGVEATWLGLQELNKEHYPIWLGMALVPVINQPEILGERYPIITQLVQSQLAAVENSWQRGWLLKAAGEVALVANRYEEAVRHFREGGDLFQQIGDDWSKAWCYGSLGRALCVLNRYEEAEHYYHQNIDICRKIGDISGEIDTLQKLASAALLQTLYQKAENVLLQGFESAILCRVHPSALTYLLYTLAELRIAQNRKTEAVEHLATLASSSLVHNGWREPEITALQAHLEALRSQMSIAEYEAAVTRGKSLDIVGKVQLLLRHSPPIQHIQSSSLIEPLTERETEVLQLIAEGKSNRQIANELTLSIGTIKTHAHNIYGKLGASNRTEATIRARELNLV